MFVIFVSRLGRAVALRLSEPHSLSIGTLRFTERQRDGNVLRQRVN